LKLTQDSSSFRISICISTRFGNREDLLKNKLESTRFSRKRGYGGAEDLEAQRSGSGKELEMVRIWRWRGLEDGEGRKAARNSRRQVFGGIKHLLVMAGHLQPK